MDPAEIKRLAAEVSVQHGIRLDPDDPIMAVVTLNRLILERALGATADLIQSATAECVQIRAGSVVAAEVRESVATIRAEMQKDIENARLKAFELVGGIHRAESKTETLRWIATGLLAGVILFLAGVVTGILIASH
jgi:hypothetical protein